MTTPAPAARPKLVQPTNCPQGDPYTAHAEGCSTLHTLTFPLRGTNGIFDDTDHGHGRHCCECGAFQPCMDAVRIFNGLDPNPWR